MMASCGSPLSSFCARGFTTDAVSTFVATSAMLLLSGDAGGGAMDSAAGGLRSISVRQRCTQESTRSSSGTTFSLSSSCWKALRAWTSSASAPSIISTLVFL